MRTRCLGPGSCPGYFAEADLEVEIIAPADPNDPPKLVAAGQADVALDTARYARFAAFLERQGLIKTPPPIKTYARELPR